MLPAYKCVPAGIPFPTRLSFPNPCSFFPAFALPINRSPQLCFRKILLIRKDCFQPLPLFPLRFPAAPAALHSKTTSFQLSRCSSCPLFCHSSFQQKPAATGPFPQPSSLKFLLSTAPTQRKPPTHFLPLPPLFSSCSAPENQNQNRRIHLPTKLAVFYKPLCSSNCFRKGTSLPQTHSPNFSPTILPYLPQPSL